MKSIVWGDADYPVTQEFGVPGFRADWYQYSSELGWPAGYHVGIDVAVPKGTPIFAAEPGRVIQAGFSEYFRPKPVWIEEDDGDIAIYGHLWENTVREGQRVRAGQMIGFSGEQTLPGTMTPDGSGPHLHFELRRDGKAVDPVPELIGAEGEEGSASISNINPFDMDWSTAMLISLALGLTIAGVMMLT